MKESTTRRGEVRSVSRALTILETLARVREPLGLVALSRQVSLDPTTTHRLLRTMEQQGFITQQPADGKYALGMRAFQIGNAVSEVSFTRIMARPFLQTLMENTGETANLAILASNEAAFIEQVMGLHFLRAFTEVGRAVPLHCTAVGKALLLDLLEPELRTLLAPSLKRYSPNTIVSYEELAAELRRSRERGYTTDQEEFERGARCLAAPVRGTDDRILCAVGIDGPIERMPPERVKALVPLLLSVTAEMALTLRLTHQPRL